MLVFGRFVHLDFFNIIIFWKFEGNFNKPFMKIIVQFKKLFIIPLLFLMVGNVCLGQITYTGLPTTESRASCPPATPDEVTNCATFKGGVIKAFVSVNGANATINLIKCDGTAFGRGTSGKAGTYYLKPIDVCGGNNGTVIAFADVTNGRTVVPITVPLTHTGTLNYRITFTTTTNSGTVANPIYLKYYTNNLSITGTCTTTNNVNPTNISFSNITTTQATASWPNVSGAIGYEINYILFSAPNFSGSLTTSTSGTSVNLTGLTAGTQYKMQIRTVFPNGCYSIWSGSSNSFTTSAPCGQVNGANSSASSVSSNSFTANWSAVTGANYYNVNVKKCSEANYDNAVTFRTNNNTTSTAISGLECGACFDFQVQAVCSSEAGTWSGSNPVDIVLGLTNSSASTFSNSTSTSFVASWPAVSNAIGYEVNYTTCTGTYVYQGLPSATNSLTIGSLTPSTSYKIQVRAKFGANCFGAWGGSSNCVSTAAPTPSCITWSGTPPTGEKLTAANYLCEANIIQKTQNGTQNNEFGITRELLAKITYLSIFKEKTLNSLAVNFPVPFTDLQGTPNQYIDAIKTLAYLQFKDEITPFDRDRFNFNPEDLIERKYVIKALAEAFNISKSTATPSPFSDVPTSHPLYGYIKRFHELGLITGNSVYTTSCTTGTCFHPDQTITRENMFVILYRILTSTALTRPTAAQLADKANYFTPGNNRMATMGKVPGIDQANFNHYQKTSFSIAGRGVSLDFTHTYNSFLTELPKGFFEEGDEDTKQKFTPLGIGWTHTYNIYAQKIVGYTGEADKIMIFYPDGSINTFNYTTGVAEGVGIYDEMTKTAIAGGERITILTKGQIKYVFENYNNGKFYFIKSIKDRNNNGVKCTWQQILSGSRYRLATVQEEFNNNSLGRSLTFTYANLGGHYLSQVTDNSIGRTIKFNVQASSKNLLSYTDPKNQVTTYSYDPSGSFMTANLLTQIQLPKGNKITNTYVQNKLKQSQTFSQANVATSTTAVNWVPEYASGQQYNSTATITDSQKRQTKYTHNSLGNPTKIESPTGTSTFNSYDAGNNANLPTSLTINGQQSGISYDSKGNIKNVTKNGISNKFTYTTLNDVETHTDGRGFLTTYTYEGVGNLKTVQRPSGYGSTTIERNSFGQVKSVTNPSGIKTIFDYNDHGLTDKITMPLGISTSSTYDDASRLKSTTDANGKKNTFLYDENDNLRESTDADSKIVKHTYDENDNHKTVVNQKGEPQTMNYNWDDDTLKDETFGLHVKKYTYYEDGSLKTHTRGNGVFNYNYFPDGRLQSDGQTSYTYDARGNIKTVTKVATSETLNLNYDPNDRLDDYFDYYGNKVDYSYDNNNNVTEIIYPGNKTVKYTYDAVNRCTDVTDWNTKNTHFDYETDDRIKKITLPNGTFTDYTYDDAGRMTDITNKKTSGTIITNYHFELDPAGNHKQEMITEPSITAGLQSISNQTVTYGDAPFNQLQSQGSTSFTHNTAGGITQAGSNAYKYDLNDNMLTAPNSSFSYDGAGNRRAKTVGGVNTRYVLSILGMSQVLMETNSSNALQNYYVYGPTGLLYRLKADNTTYSYYHYDYRGSTTAITNNAQTITHSYSYDPFGKVLAKTEADANPFQYVGRHGVQYESPTVTFMRARYYDPTIGRFLSEDPIWALNLYPYADNNPIIFSDVDGNKKCQCVGYAKEYIGIPSNQSTVASAYLYKDYLKENYSYEEAFNDIKPGDILVIDRGSSKPGYTFSKEHGHIAVVESVGENGNFTIRHSNVGEKISSSENCDTKSSIYNTSFASSSRGFHFMRKINKEVTIVEDDLFMVKDDKKTIRKNRPKPRIKLRKRKTE
jgi:RHS repeat-associated protein